MSGSPLKSPNFLDTGTAKESMHFESLGGMASDLQANLSLPARPMDSTVLNLRIRKIATISIARL